MIIFFLIVSINLERVKAMRTESSPMCIYLQEYMMQLTTFQKDVICWLSVSRKHDYFCTYMKNPVSKKANNNFVFYSDFANTFMLFSESIKNNYNEYNGFQCWPELCSLHFLHNTFLTNLIDKKALGN